MANNFTEKRLKIAFRLTLVCAMSLLIGGGSVWSILRQDGPEALVAIIPMMVVGAIHLFCGPIAIFNAHKTYSRKSNLYIYVYFLFHIVISFVIVGPEIIIYVLLFTVFTLVPITICVILPFIKHE